MMIEFKDPIKEIASFYNENNLNENKNQIINNKKDDMCNEEINRLKEQLTEYHKKIKELELKIDTKKEKVLTIYENLSFDTKESLKNITRGDVYTALILNAEKLYDIAVYMFNNNKPDFNNIKILYELVFDKYRKIKNTNYQNVKIGDEYDYEKHIKPNRLAKSSGHIKEIILKAPRNKKSIVII
jgi:predicted transcriptional regulator